MEHGKTPGALYIDLSKAFDTPSFDIILYKLNYYRPISRVVIGREVDYRSRLIYVRYCLTNTTLCL